MKNSMLIHHDFYDTFKLFTSGEVGDLLMAALEYDMNGITTEFEDRALQLCYQRLIYSLDRNTMHYEAMRKKRMEAACKRWNKEAAEPPVS